MIRGGKHGFTIIEVLFFISISGLLMVMAMTTVSRRQKFVEFSDSMRSLQSFVESQVSETRNGVNDHPINCSSTGGNAASCSMLGRVMIFTEGSSSIDYYTLIGNRLTADSEATCGTDLLECADPRTENFQRKYQILWGVNFIGGRHLLNSQYQLSRAFGLLRNPRSSAVLGISYGNDNDIAAQVINDAASYHTSSSPVIIGLGENVDAYYCFESSRKDQTAAITLKGAETDVTFSPQAEGLDCDSL